MPVRRGGAGLVAGGILLSRVFGLVRARLLARFLGAGDEADALTAAIRIPNILQILFGEGVLSASFIPTYVRTLAHGDADEAGRLAGAIGALVALASAVLVVVGVVLAPLLIPIIAPGFSGEKRVLTILLVRIMFPAVGLLVMSAWALGVLNSHRKFFLAYASPVAFNVVVIAVLLTVGERQGAAHLAQSVAWASVVGSGVQFLVQLPVVWRVERRLRLNAQWNSPKVRAVLTNFLPIFAGRGVVQLSAYADQWLATLLPAGALTILNNAQTVSILPVSLFGMSVAAAALPSMSRENATSAEGADRLRASLGEGLHRVAFYVVPSSVALIGLGDVIGATLFGTGKFGAPEIEWLWAVLAGSAIGLLASTLSRLYASTWYALGDTRTPLRFALLRVTLTLGLGAAASLVLPGALGVDAKWGVAGLTASAGIAAWLEATLLRRSIAKRLGHVPVDRRYLTKLWLGAALSLAPAILLRRILPATHPFSTGIAVLVVYGVAYLGGAVAVGIPEVRLLQARLLNRWGRA